MVIVYFGYYVLIGEQGVFNWLVIENEICEIEIQFVVVQVECEYMEEIVFCLCFDSLDFDYFDECVCVVLNVVYFCDFIVEIDIFNCC